MILKSYLLVGALLCAVYAYAMFMEDNHRVCGWCGSERFDEWDECCTCHNCGRVK